MSVSKPLWSSVEATYCDRTFRFGRRLGPEVRIWGAEGPATGSVGGKAAVDDEDLARHVAAGVADQEEDRADHLVG